jgi:hypothetical protein
LIALATLLGLRCVLWFLYANRKGADCPFREILCFDTEGMIEASAVVLPRNCGRQFDQLPVAESPAQAGEERIRDFDRRLGHGIGVFQHQALEFGEIEV